MPEFKESDHPRDDGGKFTDGSGASGAGTERGPFGPVLKDYRHDAKGAIAKLKEMKDGEAVGALHHPDVGDFDLVWGEEGDPERNYDGGYGLAKIAAKHPEVVDKLQEILYSMKKNPEKSGKNRLILESDDHRATVRLDWDGNVKHWLLTAYVKEKRGGAEQSPTSIGLDGEVDGLSTAASRAILARLTAYYQPSAFALDRASVRSTDADGRLHVSITNISKSNVCGYFGREIPNAQALGLDAGRIYQLLRDPQELQKAAPTFNNIPLLDEHIPVSAAAPQKNAVVGSTGTDAVFDGAYLKNSLVVWDAGAIAGINTGEQKELSAAYRYVADMTPGVYQGVPYDGVMRQIRGNHVALVPIGRAGADVVVGDSLPKEFPLMKIEKGKTGVVNAALCGHILPKLALDGAPIPQIKALVKQASTVEQLAQDAAAAFPKAGVTADELTRLLRLAMDADEPDPDDGKKPKADDDPDKDKKAEDEDKDDDPDKGGKKKPDDDDKPAQDAAVIVQKAEAAAMARFQAIRAAERDVAPLVGEVAAMDSAGAVYRFAMDALGIDHKGVHESAYPALIRMHKAQTQAPRQSDRLGMDAAAKDELAALMPNAFGSTKQPK